MEASSTFLASSMARSRRLRESLKKQFSGPTRVDPDKIFAEACGQQGHGATNSRCVSCYVDILMPPLMLVAALESCAAIFASPKRISL